MPAARTAGRGWWMPRAMCSDRAAPDRPTSPLGLPDPIARSWRRANGRSALRRTHAGVGVAGLDDPALARSIAARRFGFASVTLRSDAVTACIGAHGHQDGSGIVILGTGSQGIVRLRGTFRRVGGWGFLL